jgi:hypothetical protein
MYYLRELSVHDVLRALKRRDPWLALRISQNLCSNALNTVRANLVRRSRIRARTVRRPSCSHGV